MHVDYMVALTQRGKYALKALAFLARRFEAEANSPVVGSLIAASEQIPAKFLEGILADLKRQGYLQSRKGRGGGYWLTRSPTQVHLGAVLRIFEGPLAPIPCVSKRYYAPCSDCRDEGDCEVRRTMAEVKLAILAVLDRTTLADMVAKDGQAIPL